MIDMELAEKMILEKLSVSKNFVNDEDIDIKEQVFKHTLVACRTIRLFVLQYNERCLKETTP